MVFARTRPVLDRCSPSPPSVVFYPLSGHNCKLPVRLINKPLVKWKKKIKPLFSIFIDYIYVRLAHRTSVTVRHLQQIIHLYRHTHDTPQCHTHHELFQLRFIINQNINLCNIPSYVYIILLSNIRIVINSSILPIFVLFLL